MTSRRVILTGTGAALLAGCQTYGAEQPAQPQPTAPGAAPGPAQPLAQINDIPVGGGKVFADKNVVVTQPTAGVFRAFSATCTHQGCKVADVAGGTINCPCHGSAFNVADGSVADGPAKRALPAVSVTVTVADGSIKLG